MLKSTCLTFVLATLCPPAWAWIELEISSDKCLSPGAKVDLEQKLGKHKEESEKICRMLVKEREEVSDISADILQDVNTFSRLSHEEALEKDRVDHRIRVLLRVLCRCLLKDQSEEVPKCDQLPHLLLHDPTQAKALQMMMTEALMKETETRLRDSSGKQQDALQNATGSSQQRGSSEGDAKGREVSHAPLLLILLLINLLLAFMARASHS